MFKIIDSQETDWVKLVKILGVPVYQRVGDLKAISIGSFAIYIQMGSEKYLMGFRI